MVRTQAPSLDGLTMLTTLTKYNYIILTSSLGNYELAKMIRQMWLQRPSPKGLKPLMSAAPDWQPDLRNVKQYGITISKPKFITLDNRTSAIFNEAAVSASLPHFFAK
jgi:esterase/lipase superfamily enzyme